MPVHRNLRLATACVGGLLVTGALLNLLSLFHWFGTGGNGAPNATAAWEGPADQDTSGGTPGHTWGTRSRRAPESQAEQDLTSTNCSACIFKARQGSHIRHTLIYHTQRPTGCTPRSGPGCIHNTTMYSLCTETTGETTCYNPRYPERVNVSVWVGLPRTSFRTRPEGEGRLYHLNSTLVRREGTPTYTLVFDACVAMGASPMAVRCGSDSWVSTYKGNHKYLCPTDPTFATGDINAWALCGRRDSCTGKWDCVCLHTSGWTPEYGTDWGTTIYPSNCSHVQTFTRLEGNKIQLVLLSSHPPLETYGLGVDAIGRDPLTYISVMVTPIHDGQRIPLGWTVYDNLAKLDDSPLPSSATAHNLFVEMAEEVAKSLLLKNCFVCGGTGTSRQWPWEALEVTPDVYNNMSRGGSLAPRATLSPVTWVLTTNLIGRQCFTRPRTNSSYEVGSLLCLGTWEGGYGKWNSTASLPEPAWFNLTLLPFLNTSSPREWQAPVNMYWICGPMAYEWLPADWSGSCILGWIKPSFFLLPLKNRQRLGVPVYDTLGSNREGREVDNAFSNFPCKEAAHYDAQDDTWSSERIVCVYGAATWAKDSSWGYRTPIYLLNRIIRLQAVLSLAGERIDKALNILAQTTDKIRTAVYQNRLALDYLLAREGGVCGKFNLSNCCLGIDETGEVIRQLTTEMRQLTYNAPQEWSGFNLSGLFGSWFPKLPGLQAIVALIGLIAAGCVIVPCVLPILVRTISGSLSLLVERRARAHALAIWQYHRLTQRGDPEDEV